MLRTLWQGLALAWLTILPLACDSGGGDGSGAAPAGTPVGDAGAADALASSDGAGPAPTPLNDDGSCKTDGDCGSGEYCSSGVCQIRLCSAPSYTSVPPLGAHTILQPFRNILVVDQGVSAVVELDAITGAPSGATWAPAGTVIDTAAGNFFGDRAESVAIAVDGSPAVSIVRSGSMAASLALPFAPVAIAAGDVDGDGADELVALGTAGDVAVCHPSTSTCTPSSLPGETGLDVTVADVDGDGLAEPVFLVSDANSPSTLIVWNVDTGKSVATPTTATFMKIAAADLAGNGTASVLGLEDGGWADLASDKLHVLGVTDGAASEVSSMDVDVDAADVFAGVYDGGTRATVFVLSDSNTIEVYSPDLVAGPTLELGTSNATALALADVDGVSPSATLQAPATLVPGRLVPTAVLLYPPYSSTQSSGTSSILAGDSQTQSSSASDSVGLTSVIGAGFEVDVPGVVKATVLDKVGRSMQTTHTNAVTVTMADDYRVDARPGLTGPDNAAVILGNGCYHAYDYLVSDPSNKMGADGTTVVLFVPVGGQTSLWSLKRYQALAGADAGLPAISVPIPVGDPTQYPATPQTLAGQPIPSSELVLGGDHVYRTSDVALVGWQLTSADLATTSTTTSVTTSAIGQVRLGTAVVYGETDGTFATQYSVSVGQAIYFGGWVPPVSDLAADGYSFSPIVYADPLGYFVATYTVGR